jgi:hypothetical protein
MKPSKEFEIVECGGTLYEIGKQYGEACRESILKSLDMNLGAFEQTYHCKRGPHQLTGERSQISHLETVTSLIMVPEERIMYLACEQPCKYEYVEYSL